MMMRWKNNIMLQTKKVTSDVCAVAFDPTEIMVRQSGRKYFGKERGLVKLDGNKLIVDSTVAKEFGIEILMKG